MSFYRDIIIETYENRGEPSAERIRTRPLPGQGLSTLMKVECSIKMREAYPPGTKLKIRAKVTSREGGTEFLYCHYSWPYEVFTDDEATEFIRERYPNAR